MALLQFGPIGITLLEIGKFLLVVFVSGGVAGWICRMGFQDALAKAMRGEGFTGSMLEFFESKKFRVIMIGVFDERYATKAELQALRDRVDYWYARQKDRHTQADATGSD